MNQNVKAVQKAEMWKSLSRLKTVNFIKFLFFACLI